MHIAGAVHLQGVCLPETFLCCVCDWNCGCAGVYSNRYTCVQLKFFIYIKT